MRLLDVVQNLFHALVRTEAVLDRIQQKLEKAMATLQNFQDMAKAVDAETTRLANKIQALVGELAADGMTEAEEAEALSGLTAVADRLKTIGADPSNPIPVEPPVA